MTERFTYRVDDDGWNALLDGNQREITQAMQAVVSTLVDDEMSERELRDKNPNHDSGINYALRRLMHYGCIVRIDNHDDAA